MSALSDSSDTHPSTISRKKLRQWLTPLEKKKIIWPLGLLIFDYLVFLGLITAAVLVQLTALQWLFSLAAGFWIGRLFILGHDACHQAYTPSRPLNRVLGRLAFLPSLTPYSLWEVGHNVVHHGYTNLKDVDFVWAPLSADEYRALPPMRRWLERVYRSGWGVGLYYLLEIWFKRMFFPNRKMMPTRRAVFWADNFLVATFALLWAAALIAFAASQQRSLLTALFFGLVLPFLMWNAMIGFVVYVHHTHPEVRWYRDKQAWAAAMPVLSGTVHLTFPYRVGTLLHHIMEHTAHHVSMGIPLYRLQQAQAVLEEKLPLAVVKQRFSWRWYFHTAAACKLYDFHRQCWTDFNGRVTS